MIKAFIFDPYLDTLGGGERYALGVGLTLSRLGYMVELAWHQPDILSQATSRFGLDYSPIIVRRHLYEAITLGNNLSKLNTFKEYDLIFWVSDGSLPTLNAKKNLVHFQVPFKKIGGNQILNQIKAASVKSFVYNSQFTQDVVAPQLPFSKSAVLYPPVSVDLFRSNKPKEKLIISVARFDSPSHSKRQDVLIDAFRSFHLNHPDYRLVLLGGLRGDDSHLNPLRGLVGDLPIEFVINPDFPQVLDLYQRATFFWHAAGFGVDEKEHPENVEHFGITTVEAMAAGCIPIVINRGGQREIIDQRCGFLCETVQELAGRTHDVANNSDLMVSMSSFAVEKSSQFGLDRFQSDLQRIIA